MESSQRTRKAAKSERKRREEMKELCSTLVSLLPSQYVNGTRCLSDRLDEAAKYIVDLQKEISDLEQKTEVIKFRSKFPVQEQSKLSGSKGAEVPRVILRKVNNDSFQVIVEKVKKGVKISSILETIEFSGASVVNANLLSSGDVDFVDIVFKVSELQKFDEVDFQSRLQRNVVSQC